MKEKIAYVKSWFGFLVIARFSRFCEVFLILRGMRIKRGLREGVNDGKETLYFSCYSVEFPVIFSGKSYSDGFEDENSVLPDFEGSLAAVR